MSIFAKQVPRLMRVDWNRMGPQALAQEIAAIWLSDEPIEITSPVKLTSDGNDSPLTITTNTPATGATPDPITYVFNDTPVSPGPSPPPPPPPPPPSGSGNAFSAQVLNQVSGVNYNCTLYPGGVAAVVEMKNLVGTSLLPSGIWVPVIQVGTEYHGFPNCFYGP